MEASEFWNKIKYKLNEMGKTQDWLFSEAGLPIQAMRNRIYKDRIPSLEDSMKLFAILGIKAEDFYNISIDNMENQKSFRSIPIMDQKFSAGKGEFVPDKEDISGYIAVPKELSNINDENLGACYVHGDSMYPTLHDGDLIIADNLGYDGKEGIYLIHLNGSGYVKRLQRTATGVKIISDNAVYPAMEEKEGSDNFRVIGRVHTFQRQI